MDTLEMTEAERQAMAENTHFGSVRLIALDRAIKFTGGLVACWVSQDSLPRDERVQPSALTLAIARKFAQWLMDDRIINENEPEP